MTTKHITVPAKSLTALFKKFWNDEEAATAVEYGLIAALIGAFIAGAVHALGSSLSSLFGFISGRIDSKQ